MGRIKGRKHSHALTIVQKYFPDVKEVHDADEDFPVEVTAADSRTARTKDHNNCAMAVAVKRQAKAKGVIISVKKAYIIKKEGAVGYNLPESVSREIVSFDRKAGFAEGSYNLSKPGLQSRLGGRKPITKGARSPNYKKRKFHLTSNIRVALNRKES